MISTGGLFPPGAVARAVGRDGAARALAALSRGRDGGEAGFAYREAAVLDVAFLARFGLAREDGTLAHALSELELSPALREMARAGFSDASLERFTPITLEFETAVAHGTVGEVFALSRRKSLWGRMLRVRPLSADTALRPARLAYELLDSNPSRQRALTRGHYKAFLGRKQARLVRLALDQSRGRFLVALREDERLAITASLRISPETFWRDVRRGNIDHARELARQRIESSAASRQIALMLPV